MDKIEWTDQFGTGNKAIDTQHMKIIEMINNLIEKGNEGVSSEPISETLAEMLDYSIHHFKMEEELMVDVDYDGLVAHKELHRAFRTKTAKFYQATLNHVEQVPDALLGYLKGWWTHHILNDDMKLKSFLSRKEHV